MPTFTAIIASVITSNAIIIITVAIIESIKFVSDLNLSQKALYLMIVVISSILYC